MRQRLVTEGFAIALNGQHRQTPPRKKLLDGKQESQIIALRLSDPPEGRNGWTLRLLAEKAVELEIVEHISHVTVSSTLKKQNYVKENPKLGDTAKAKRRVRNLPFRRTASP